MATMGSYCKAYPIDRFKEYRAWREKPLSGAGSEKAYPEDPEDERYLFLQETFVVTDGIFLDEDIVFDEITPEWEEFCGTQLKFEVPDLDGAPVNHQETSIQIQGDIQ